MTEVAIVVVTYNRPISLKRLLDSLKASYYDDMSVRLIISIDNSGNTEVANISNEFIWPYGEKEVIIHSERLGLKKHILQCGDYSVKYGAVIVLEDDMFVSPYFYKYAIAATNNYESDERIAGISLYSHHWNMSTYRPFIPAEDGNDAYFLQFAQSWGQLWTSKMWLGFKKWYEQNNGVITYEEVLPNHIVDWPESSWLKYYMKYIIKTNKYFVYPRISLTTNFGDLGQHATVASTNYQVPLLYGNKDVFKFPSLDGENIKYDAFFERMDMGWILNIADSDLCVNLYSKKRNSQKKKYLLTMDIIDFHIIASYGLNIRPHEMNVLYRINGNDIFLYDTTINESNPFSKLANVKLLQHIYDIRDIDRNGIFRLAINHIYSALKRKLCGVIK